MALTVKVAVAVVTTLPAGQRFGAENSCNIFVRSEKEGPKWRERKNPHTKNAFRKKDQKDGKRKNHKKKSFFLFLMPRLRVGLQYIKKEVDNSQHNSIDR